jgi:hypothetical protein
VCISEILVYLNWDPKFSSNIFNLYLAFMNCTMEQDDLCISVFWNRLRRFPIAGLSIDFKVKVKFYWSHYISNVKWPCLSHGYYIGWQCGFRTLDKTLNLSVIHSLHL